MTTDSVSAGAPVTFQSQFTDLDGGAPLSAESLMIYCQARLGNLDNDIKGLMDEQRAAIRQKEVLKELKRDLEACEGTGLDYVDDPTEEARVRAAIDAYDKAIAALPPGDPVRAQLEQQKRELFYEPDADPDYLSQQAGVAAAEAAAAGTDPELKYIGAKTDVPDDIWDTVGDEIDSLIERVNDDAEIKMIELQSLMSTRQTAISLTTNILNKLQQSADGIANNIR